MHKAFLLGAVAMLTIAGSAQAQAPGAGYPQPGMQVQRPPMPQPPRAPMAGRRWGSQVGGRWWGGANAPGGWAAYRQPSRGYRVPSYWIAPRFYVSDWSRYGLYAPTGGYNWVRYYDDAVLIDGSGNVSDWRGGLAWDGADYAYDERRDSGSSGIGGAVAGAVVGGVVGNVVAGRGNRLGGTLIGAGVGTALGYGVDRAASRGRRGPPPGYRDGWRGEPEGPPSRDRDGRDRHGEHGYPPLPPGHPPIGPQGAYGHGGPSSWTSDDGRTTIVTTTGGGYGGGYGAPPVIVQGGGHYAGGTTTVTIQSAPVVTTTTTTEIIEDTVTYRRPAVRHVVRARVWHARPRCTCAPVRVRHRAPAVIGS